MEQIEFRNVEYVYSPKTPFRAEALKGVDFSFASNDFVALIGKTGSGKSTIIEHLNGLLTPSNGEVQIGEFLNSADKKRRTKKLAPLTKKVGLVFQFAESQLFEDTVLKDVAYGPRNHGFTKSQAEEMARNAILEVGLDKSFFERSPFSLSGGEKRRVAIAGVLALDPDILVLDEPTSGLDPEGASEMMDLFKGLHESRNKGIVMVTHDMDLVVRYCKRAAVVSEGKIAYYGEVAGLADLDLEKYGLERPPLWEAVRLLKEHGHDLSYGSVHDEDDLAEALSK